jgi:hypothetical protein
VRQLVTVQSVSVRYGSCVRVWLHRDKLRPSPLPPSLTPTSLLSLSSPLSSPLSFSLSFSLCRYLVSGSKDMSARIYSVTPVEGFVPITLSAHRSTIVSASFASDTRTLYTVSKDGSAYVWEWTERTSLPSGVLAAAGLGAKDDVSAADIPAVVRAARQNQRRGGARSVAARGRAHIVPDPLKNSELSVLYGEWMLATKHYFKQDHAKVCVCVCVSNLSVVRTSVCASSLTLLSWRCCCCCHRCCCYCCCLWRW